MLVLLPNYINVFLKNETSIQSTIFYITYLIFFLCLELYFEFIKCKGNPLNISFLLSSYCFNYFLALLLYLLLTLLAHDCSAQPSTNHFIRFVHDTTVVALINNVSGSDETG